MKKRIKNAISSILNRFDFEIRARKPKGRFLDSNVSNPEYVRHSTTIKYSKFAGKIVVGENCLIHASVIYGNVEIGKNTSINGGATEIHYAINPMKIGSYCSIARGTAIQEVNHNTKSITTYYIHKHVLKTDFNKDMVSKGPIIIGNDVWVGAASTILSGVTIGNGAIIAANSVVNTDVPDYDIYGGTPTKLLKYRFSEEIVAQLNTIKWWE